MPFLHTDRKKEVVWMSKKIIQCFDNMHCEMKGLSTARVFFNAVSTESAMLLISLAVWGHWGICCQPISRAALWQYWFYRICSWWTLICQTFQLGDCPANIFLSPNKFAEILQHHNIQYNNIVNWHKRFGLSVLFTLTEALCSMTPAATHSCLPFLFFLFLCEVMSMKNYQSQDRLKIN